MPTIRCTKKLLTWIGLTDPPDLPDTDDDWYAHTFALNRRKHILFAHEASGFVCVSGPLLKKQASDLTTLFGELLASTMQMTGYNEETIDRYLEKLGEMSVSRTTKRTGTATATFAIGEVQSICRDFAPESVPDIAVEYNRRPFRRIDYRDPVEDFSRMLGVETPSEPSKEEQPSSEPKPPSGTCSFCGAIIEETPETAIWTERMSAHLASCEKRAAAIRGEENGSETTEDLLHIIVGSMDFVDFRLHLEIPATAPLALLDRYLRAIWLECCGHMSEFWTEEPWRSTELPMTTTIADALEASTLLSHVYDMGSCTFTVVEMVDSRPARPATPHGITLLARNRMPEATCLRCDRPARWICMECVYEDETHGLHCDLHEGTHGHYKYGDPLPLVNSPRAGVCGYVGPGEAPSVGV